jgi:hypothetical protein
LLPALLRGFSKKEHPPLAEGKHAVRGTSTVHLDVWLTKGGAVEARKALPKGDVLALCLQASGIDPARMRELVQHAGRIVAAGEPVVTPEIDLALESIRDLMPVQTREGALAFAGEVAILGWSAEA